jgi:hypothetical protein
MPLKSIGTLNEGPLHQALKARYAIPGSATECEIDGFVADVVVNGRIIEIQTGGFSPLRRKLASLLKTRRVMLVHPIARNRYIVKVSSDSGAVITRRKSPKHGKVYDIFSELVSIPTLLDHPNMTLELVFIEEEEVRVYDGKRGWRRGGWLVTERRLIDVKETVTISSMNQLFAAIADDLPVEFTTKDVAKLLASRLRLGQQAAYCFREAGLIEICGKMGNALIYRRSAVVDSDTLALPTN